MGQGACKFPAVTNMSQKQRPLTTEMLSEGSTETIFGLSLQLFWGLKSISKLKVLT